MANIPPVTLDTTLAELYQEDGADDRRSCIAMVLAAASSEVDPTSRLARNRKYLYQDSTFSTTPESIPPRQRKEIQRATAIKYLSLVSQHDAFAAGNMPVILFDPDSGEETATHSREEAKKTMDALIESQRPNMLFFPGPREISMVADGIDLLMPKMALDGLDGLPLAINLDTHYFLNSKAALCTSGLPWYVN